MRWFAWPNAARRCPHLQKDPVSTPRGVVNQLLRNRTLTLAERYRVDPVRVLHLSGEAEEAAHRVGASGEDEDEGRGVGHVLVQGGELDWRALDKLAAQVLSHKVHHRKHHLKLQPGIERDTAER